MLPAQLAILSSWWSVTVIRRWPSNRMWHLYLFPRTFCAHRQAKHARTSLLIIVIKAKSSERSRVFLPPHELSGLQRRFCWGAECISQQTKVDVALKPAGQTMIGLSFYWPCAHLNSLRETWFVLFHRRCNNNMNSTEDVSLPGSILKNIILENRWKRPPICKNQMEADLQNKLWRSKHSTLMTDQLFLLSTLWSSHVFVVEGLRETWPMLANMPRRK